MKFKVGDYFTYVGILGSKRYGFVHRVNENHKNYIVSTANTLENLDKYKDYIWNWTDIWSDYGVRLTMQPLDNFSVKEEDLWE